MLLWRSRVPIVPFSFSVRACVEHFPVSDPITFRSQTRKICSKIQTITSIEGSPHFKNFNSRQKEQINLYVDALLDWNQKMNLTAVKDVTEIMERHIEDSLAIMPPMKCCYTSHCKKTCDKLSLVDVGSGAGLPGLVLAIAFPGWEVTLLESMNKRCVFLEHVVDLTGLSNVQVVRGRAERDFSVSEQVKTSGFPMDLGQNFSFREQYDIAVARAVAEMRILAEYCLPLVRVGGLFVAAKGHDPQLEVRNAERAIQLMGASVLELCSVESHSPYGQRTAVVCFKDRPTPRRYPRDPGTPSKEPL